MNERTFLLLSGYSDIIIDDHFAHSVFSQCAKALQTLISHTTVV